MIERLDILIAEARELSLAREWGEAYGYSDEFFVTAARNAANRLQRFVIAEAPDVEPFAAWYEWDCVADTESYAVPRDCFADNLIHAVQYSQDGSEQNYYDLEKAYRREAYYPNGWPDTYFVDGGRIYVAGVPRAAGGKYRCRYEKRIPLVDLVRGQVTSYAGALPNPTSILLDDDDYLDSTKLETTPEYVNVVDRRGTILMPNIEVDSWDTASRTLTIASGFAARSDDTLPAGAFLTTGWFASTHFLVDACCRDFFVQFMVKSVHALQSSTDILTSDKELNSILESIAEVYRVMPGGKSGIPEHRGDY